MGDKQRKLKDKASVYYREGKLKDALKIYERVVADDPAELQCQIKIGDIYRKLGNREAAVKAYAPVATAYAEDGLLLKAIAVGKLILSVEPRHTATQEMLADLYSKRRAPARMPMTPPPVDTPAPIELPEVDETPEVTRTSQREPPIVQGTPETPGAPKPPIAEQLVEQNAPPPPQWPPVAASKTPAPAPNAPPSIPWPTSTPPSSSPSAQADAPVTIEDSVLDITVGEVLTESEASAPAAEADDAALMGQDTDQEIQSLLSEMSDEPLQIAAQQEEEVVELTQPKRPKMNIPVEETWAGVIKLEDLDKQEELAETLQVDDAPSDVREAPPIELTKRVTESTGDIADELERPQIPLFSDLPKSAFIELLVQMEMKEMMPGEHVITEGEVGHSFFVLASGRVRITRKSETGEEVTLAYLTDGAFFGEMALLQDGARTASVIVEEESQVFEISKAVLDNVVSSFPSVANVLKNFYKQRLLATAMATNPLFRPFDGEQRRELMELFKSKSFDEGEVILKQGKKGTGLFLLLHGKLYVKRKKEDGSEISLAELGPGDMFGEMSLLTGQPTYATVAAATDCFVVRLSKRKFDEVIMTHPQILELVSQVSDERKSVNDMILGHQPMMPPEGAILV